MTPTTLNPADIAAVHDIVTHIQYAWNSADGFDYAKHFAADADFVNIFGMHGRGRAAIAAAHDMILHGVYLGSELNITIEQIRMLSENVLLAHLRSRLHVPRGPLAGDMDSLPSMVLTRNGAGWQIAAFHNVLITTPPALHNNGQPL